jgi:peptide/nickel transport system substrate-binding protein
VLGVAGLGLAGCAQPAAPSAPTAGVAAAPTAGGAAPAPSAAPAAAQPKYGGTLKIISNTGATGAHFDPHMPNGPGLSYDSSVIYSKVLTYKWGRDVAAPSYIPQGDLAESWTQPDDTTYLFKLRPGVKCHNVAPVVGRELTADDVTYSLRRIIDLKSAAPPLASVTRIEAPDRATVKLTLSKPNADFLDDFCNIRMVIVAREAVELKGDLKDGPLIGTGAWVLDSFDRAQGNISAKRNPDYFQKGRPYADAWVSIKASDPSVLISAFRAGEVNALGVAYVAPPSLDELQRVPGAHVVPTPADRSPILLRLNAKMEPFTDIRLRQAVSKAIDRKAIIDVVQAGQAKLSAGIPLPDRSWGLPDDELNRLLARDLDGAKRLLQEAGKSSGFDMEILMTPNTLSGANAAASELIQANLKDVGIRATVRPLDNPTHAKAYNDGQFQASVESVVYLAANATLYGYFYTGGALNPAGSANPALDKLIDQQAVLTKDPEARKKILLDVQRMIISDAVYNALHVYVGHAFSTAELKDLNPPSVIFNTTDFWSTAWIDK